MNKKFLGIFNIIDLIIVVLIVVIAFGALSIFKKTESGPIVAKEKIRVTFQCENAPDYAVDKLAIGDPVADESLNIKFGEIVEKPIIGENLKPLPNYDGKYVVGEMPGYKSAEIIVEGEGRISKYGVSVGSQLYGRGHSMVIRAGQNKLFVKVKNFERVDNAAE